MEKQLLEQIAEHLVDIFYKSLFLAIGALEYSDEDKADIIESVSLNVFLRVLDGIYDLNLNQHSADHLGNKMDLLLAETIKSIKSAPKGN